MTEELWVEGLIWGRRGIPEFQERAIGFRVFCSQIEDPKLSDEISLSLLRWGT